MQNQNKINSANFCCLASFEKNIEPIQRATVIVYHARERRPRAGEERQIHSQRKIGQHVCFYVLLKQKNNGQETCPPSLPAQTTEILMSNINTAEKKSEKNEKTEESKIKTVQNSALSFTDRLTVRPDWFLSLLLDLLLK